MDEINIESPHETIIESPHLEVTGWCATAVDSKDMRISVNSTPLIVQFRDRPDVVQAFPDRNCFGFVAEVNLLDAAFRATSPMLRIEIKSPAALTLTRKVYVSPTLPEALASPEPEPDIARRRQFIESNTGLSIASVLEIGKLDNPIFHPEQSDISYLDYFGTAADSEAMDAILEIRPDALLFADSVQDGQHLLKGMEQRFDLIAANHVIEHAPDAIRTIQDIQKCLNPGGRIFLSIADCNFTSSVLRRETDIVELLRNYDEELSAPSYYQYLRDTYLHRTVSATDVWTFQAESKLEQRRYTLPQAIERARQGAEHNQLPHCSVFSRDTFVNLWEELLETGLVSLEIEAISEVEYRCNEFYVLLRPTTR